MFPTLNFKNIIEFSLTILCFTGIMVYFQNVNIVNNFHWFIVQLQVEMISSSMISINYLDKILTFFRTSES